MRPIQEALQEASFAVALRHQGLMPDQGLRIRDFAGRQIDKPYDFRYGTFQQALFRLDLLAFCSRMTGDDLRKCRQWVGRINLGTGTNDKWFCSELVIASYADAGVPLTATPPALDCSRGYYSSIFDRNAGLRGSFENFLRIRC